MVGNNLEPPFAPSALEQRNREQAVVLGSRKFGPARLETTRPAAEVLEHCPVRKHAGTSGGVFLVVNDHEVMWVNLIF